MAGQPRGGPVGIRCAEGRGWRRWWGAEALGRRGWPDPSLGPPTVAQRAVSEGPRVRWLTRRAPNDHLPRNLARRPECRTSSPVLPVGQSEPYRAISQGNEFRSAVGKSDAVSIHGRARAARAYRAPAKQLLLHTEWLAARRGRAAGRGIFVLSFSLLARDK